MKVRILHLITRLPVGGAERLLISVLRKLDTNRFESVVCCIQDRGELAAEVESLGIPVISLGLMNKGGFDSRAKPAIVDLIKQHQIDLVHSHLYHANLYGRLAAKKAGVPAIISIHNTYARRKWYRHLINRWLSRYTAKIIAVSEDIRQDVVKYDGVHDDKIVTLPNGIDLDRVRTNISRDQARARLGYGDEHFLIGVVGRLEKQKGHIHLIRAIAALTQQNKLTNIRVLVAGDGRLRADLEQATDDLGIGGQVNFLGTRKDMAEILRALDLFVMPSLWEGLSLAMLEGMAAELPVIISDVGGAGEVLHENTYGVRTPPGDEVALAQAIVDLAENPEKRAILATKARTRVEEAYSAETMVRKLEAIYDNTLKRGT